MKQVTDKSAWLLMLLAILITMVIRETKKMKMKCLLL